MAHEGELVRKANGRWARYRRCAVSNAGQHREDVYVLVALELDEHHQDLLQAAERYFAQGGQPASPVTRQSGPERAASAERSFQ